MKTKKKKRRRNRYRAKKEKAILGKIKMMKELPNQGTNRYIKTKAPDD